MQNLPEWMKPCCPVKVRWRFIFHKPNTIVNTMRKKILQVLQEKAFEQEIVIAGWIRTRRDTGTFSFLEINDGSCLGNLQVIADQELANYKDEIIKLTAGCALEVTGVVKESPAKGQDVEIHASLIKVVGWADPETYPMQKKRHSFEYLREISHLRPRTNALGSVARVRSRLTMSIHNFFQERGFIQVHTPIITTSDCEGAGEMFQIKGGKEETSSVDRQD